MDLRYGWEALFMLGVAWKLITWTMRNARDSTGLPLEQEDNVLLEPPDLADVLRGPGGVSADALERMSPRERVHAYESIVAARQPSAASFPTTVPCPECGAPLGGPGIPLGFVRTCPGCGAAVAVTVEGGRVSAVVKR